MKKYIIGFWYSLPIQLFFIHFRKFQIFLIFWYVLFAVVGGIFLENYGANSLFLAPEYFDEVNALSTAIVGAALGIFILSWNITTFILLNNHIKFLATTAQPFLKYYINNGVLPLIFLIFYFFSAVHYDINKELMGTWEILLLTFGFIGGFLLTTIIGFIYFFSADKTIYYRMGDNIKIANKNYDDVFNTTILPKEKYEMRIDWFLSASLKLRKPRDVRHYSKEFLDSIFKHHHIAAVLAFFIAFIFLITIGFTSDKRLFQIPAAASIAIFFSLIVAAVGAFSIFLKNWSIPVLILFYVGLNFLYQQNILDPRNKAYGINYWNKEERQAYNRDNLLALASDSNMNADKQVFLQRLNAWKANQKEAKPILYIINTSGGGVRSATFTFNVLQRLDSVMKGELMKKTILINGASGGLLGAAYYRELYWQQQQKQPINLQDKKYINNIAKDLLNPLFSSFITRDILGPVQKFKLGNYEYVKDRGFAFERKLNENTDGVLDKSLAEYTLAEQQAIIPTMFFNSVVSRDGRKMVMCTQPVRFLMRAKTDSNKIIANDPDVIDFNSLFAKQNSTNIKVSSALRMNATFPYVLPNVWLPTNPVIDVMDAGLRDNFGQEGSLRFIEVFKEWLQQNTSKVVLIQIRDRSISDWDKPYESKSLIGIFTRPAFLLQYNWFKLQDYYQNGQLEYLSANYGGNLKRICFQYTATNKDAAASLSFHLTAREKKEIALALDNKINTDEFLQLNSLIK